MIFKRKDSPFYQIGFYYKHKYYRVSTHAKSKRLAKEIEDKKREEVIKRLLIPRAKTTIAEIIDLYLEYSLTNKRSYKSDKCQGKRFKEYFGDKLADKITTLNIEQYKAGRVAKEAKPATINRELAFLKTVYNKAIAWDKVENNPVKNVKFFKENNARTRFLTKDEIKTLLDSCTKYLWPYIVVALNTGMRHGEILNLKWADIDMERKIIYVRDSKSGEGRKLPINSILLPLFENMKKTATNEYLFTYHDKRIYALRNAFNRAVDLSGLKDFKFHDLRHTFASHLVMAGVDLMTVKELLGHKTIEMTLRYSHLAPEHKHQAIEKMTKIMGQISTKTYTVDEKDKIVNMTQKSI